MSEIDPAVMKQGKQGYTLCMACHGIDGNGVARIGPPLARSEWVLGPPENLIRLQFRGLIGPIKVRGEQWNMVMQPNHKVLGSDANIALVLTYIRNSWGNEASAITPEEVSVWRKEIGEPLLRVEDLKSPYPEKAEPKKVEADVIQEGVTSAPPIAPPDVNPGFNIWGLGLLLFAVIVFVPIWMATRKKK